MYAMRQSDRLVPNHPLDLWDVFHEKCQNYGVIRKNNGAILQLEWSMDSE